MLGVSKIEAEGSTSSSQPSVLLKTMIYQPVEQRFSARQNLLSTTVRMILDDVIILSGATEL